MGMSSTNGACGSDPNSRDNQKAASKYTDSKYAYLTLHAHAAIWKERQFKTATGELIKHFREMRDF